jgi:hypothetical protein
VSITNTTGGVNVDDNIIDGKLTTTSNSPAAKVAANNRIRGGVVGEQGSATARVSAKRSLPEREAKGEERAAARTSSAVQEADAAGDAGL